MSSVLVLGFDPHTLTVPGMDADAFRAVLDNELTRFAAEGVDAAMTLFAPRSVVDGSAEATVAAALAERPWDVVVVGGGVRKREELVEFFELVVNLVRLHAPGAAIAFNTNGGDSVEAATRWLSRRPAAS